MNYNGWQLFWIVQRLSEIGPQDFTATINLEQHNKCNMIEWSIYKSIDTYQGETR